MRVYWLHKYLQFEYRYFYSSYKSMAIYLLCSSLFNTNFRLSKDIERNEKLKRTKIQQNKNIAKVRKHEWSNEIYFDTRFFSFLFPFHFICILKINFNLLNQLSRTKSCRNLSFNLCKMFMTCSMSIFLHTIWTI